MTSSTVGLGELTRSGCTQNSPLEALKRRSSVAKIDSTARECPSATWVHSKGAFAGTWTTQRLQCPQLNFMSTRYIRKIQCTQYDILKHPYTQYDILKHLYTQYDILKHPYTQYDILKHPYTQYDILKHPYTQYDILKHRYTTKHNQTTVIFAWILHNTNYEYRVTTQTSTMKTLWSRDFLKKLTQHSATWQIPCSLWNLVTVFIKAPHQCIS
jgi:hypothetical protein